jgi:LacI family transcriptional regulator
MTRNQNSGPRGGPMARQLAKTLKAHILKHCSPGDQLPAELEMARQHKRSVTTVRAALAFLVADGLVERKFGSGTYVTDAVARRTGTTAMIYFGGPTTLLTTVWACQAYGGVLDAATAQRRHIHLAFGSNRRPYEVTEELGSRIDLSLIDSAICLEVFSPELLARLGGQVPTVSIDYPCYARGVSSCVLDHIADVAKAVDHLWRVGHRRIALVGNVDPRHPDPADSARCDGFQRAVLARGLPFRGEWVIPMRNAATTVGAVREWLSMPSAQRPTAWLCVNILWTVAEAAVELGVQVPGQLSLMAIGEEPTWAGAMQAREAKQMKAYDVQLEVRGEFTDWMDPRFETLRNMKATQIALPFAEMGQWAIDEIIRRLAEPDAAPLHNLFTGDVSPGNSVVPPTNA